MPKIILVVEDYDDARAFMKVLLESFGFRVVEAADGSKAIEVFNQAHPDLVLMDISMPVMDGLTATKIIRGSEADSHTPIIAVTAFGKRYLEQAMQAGCNELIDKPVDFDVLEPLLKQYLVS